MRQRSMSPMAMWRDKYKPDIDAVRKLGVMLRVQYLLLAHITDVEIATAPDGTTAKPASGTAVKSMQPQTVAALWEREAHAESCGALIRIQDGVVIWTDRGDTTVTSRVKVSRAGALAANRSIAIDAERFALIDLKRRLTAFRSQFEQ